MAASKKKNTAKHPTQIPKDVLSTIPFTRVYDDTNTNGGIIEISNGIFSKSYYLDDTSFDDIGELEQDDILKSFEKILNTFNHLHSYEITINNRNIDKAKFNETILMPYKKDTLDDLRAEHNEIIMDKMQEILKETHEEMQRALTEINPGGLVLSFNAELMNQRIVDIVTDINGVPNRQLKERVLGEYMCVPFGKIFRGVAVPNTVTKTLHTEKMFSPTLDSFIIKEYPMYAKIGNQIKTIKSFDRPIILVDDLLHKGYRIKAIDPALKRNNVDIKEVVVGDAEYS